MKFSNKKGFTLVELLVVITILAIISVVAYQNFGGAVDKAVGGRKISDVATIETALQQYKSDNNYYPPVDSYDSTNNLWGYSGSVTANPSNKIRVTYNGEEIDTLVSASINGGGIIYGSGTWAGVQIGAKGTVSKSTLGKYLTKDLYDPELGDLKIKSTGTKMIDAGIGRYVYATYKRGTSGTWGASLVKTGTNYNIAYTLKKDGTDLYVTKIVGDYDSDSCYTDADKCPSTLVGTSSSYLVDGQLMGTTRTGSTISTYNSISDLQGIPYSVSDFAN
ncbi:MAG: type II secretion system protein [Candidatus Gracilibacteria bacterium]|nr:type II secretion system protein [Candidatus Gracilibacteria bacterium]